MKRADVTLESYLDRVGRRLRRRTLWNGLAVAGGAVLLITMGAVALMLGQGFDPGIVSAGRLALLAALLAVGLLWLYLPLRRQYRDGGAAELEQRVPEFEGRLITYLESRGQPNPVVDLLAEDAAGIALRRPAPSVVPASELGLAQAAAVACAVALAALLAVGPGDWKYGARHLLAGWMGADTLPPRQVLVSPGDVSLRRGTDLRISATLKGFEADDAFLFVQFEDAADYESVTMVPTRQDGFEFVLPGPRQSLTYYVSAGGERSPPYAVKVVEMPELTGFELVYHYPDWTGMEPRTQAGGDVRALSGTRVELTVESDAPLRRPQLVVDGQPSDLRQESNLASGRFQVDSDGYYHLTARLGGDQVRLTPDFIIKVQPDEPPEVRLTRPGRDWRATSLEEVSTRIEARDDYGLEQLEVRYSVNGGEWQSQVLEAGDRRSNRQHWFYLEDMGPEPGSYLTPGDLVAYYAVARDRVQENQTDLFFIEVQPFDRQISQSQQSGMGGGGGGGDEISQRQKEILVSTWNLIRQRGKKPAGQIEDNAALLSRLQETLKDQATSLAQRAQARQITMTDPRIDTFVEYVELAAEAMEPAARRLAAMELEQAIQPTQTALNYLLRAEALFTEMQMSMQRNSGRPGGFGANRDLAELFELEMDLEKNQYETGQNLRDQQQDNTDSEQLARLEELARRQQELSRQANRQPQAMAEERWRQEMLQRELEELRQQMEQQAARSSQSSQDGSAEGSPGDTGSEEVQRRLANAQRAMQRASEASRDEDRQKEARQAMAEAQQQLEAAANSMQQDRRDALGGDIGDMAVAAQDLYQQQRAVQRRLDEAVRAELSEDPASAEESLSYEEETELANRKRDMLAQLERIQQALGTAAARSRQDDPETADQLDRANENLVRSQVAERLAVSATYIDYGRALFVAGSEDVTTDALRQLTEDLERAERLAQVGGGQQDPLQELQAAVRGGRAELQRQMGQGRGDANDWRRPPDNPATEWQPFADWRDYAFAEDPQAAETLNQTIGEILASVVRSDAELLTDAEIQEVLSQLRQSDDAAGNPELLAREYRQVLSLLARLELALSQRARPVSAARAPRASAVDEGYRDAAAEYFRRLSESEEGSR